MAWSRLSLAFLLVAFGHFTYILGELDPVAIAAVFDSLTVIIMVFAAWRFREGADDFTWPLAIAFLVLVPVKTFDLLTSLFDGVYPFHAGFVPIVVGTVMIGIAGVRSARGGDPDRMLRIAAALNAFGSLVYFGLGVQSIVADGSTNVGFLVGSFSATAGWSYLAMRDWTIEPDAISAPSTGTP